MVSLTDPDPRLGGPVPRRTTPAGALALLCVTAGLCTVFALFATIADWRDEREQAGWPVVSAVVERGVVDVSKRSASDTDGRRSLRYRVSYLVDGTDRVATLTTRSVYSDADGSALNAWSAAHRRGSRIDIRYDPLKSDRVMLARDDLPGSGPRSRTDASLTALCFVVCVALFLCARHFRPRTPAVEIAAESGDASLGGRGALGMATAAMGLLIVGLALHAQVRAPAAVSPGDLAAYPAGVMFVLCGIILALPPHEVRRRGILVALLVTCFAATLDWIAFGPGPRRFGGGISLGFVALGIQPGELFGRIVFGVFAALLDLFAVFAWIALRSGGSTVKDDRSAQ